MFLFVFYVYCAYYRSLDLNVIQRCLMKDKTEEWIEESGGVSRKLAEACEMAAFSKE